MKSSVTPQDKLAKQNEISRQRLAQELVKLEKVEKSDLKMIETERHRFRSRHKNLDARQPFSGSTAINVRMYETHNPGFCYHCTGAIKETGPTIKEQAPKDSYEFVRSILFTDGEVDPRKVLCLHLLTAHSTRWNNNDSSTVTPVASLLEKAKNKHFSGAWNNILPCYVVDTEEASRPAAAENVKLHEDPRKQSLENQAIRDFEEKYRQYVANNLDFGRALSTNAKHNRTALHGLGKMPTITPHVYSLLGPSHELRIKQALAEGVTRRRFARSSLEFARLDENSLSFHLDDDDDLLSRATTNLSNRNWVSRSTRSPSRRSAMGSSLKLDHGITMLKSKRSRLNDYTAYRLKSHDMPSNLVAIKPSFRAMEEAASKTSSTKSPFHGMIESRPSTNSMLSITLSPEAAMRKYRKCVYLNTPIRCNHLQSKDPKIVPILVNYQVQALVQSVLEVLERVNPEKSMRIIETARDAEEIKRMLLCPETQSFVHSLIGQSLLSSPESFVVSVAAVADEIDFRFEGVLEKEIIALTLEMPTALPLDALIAEIRNNIFQCRKPRTRLNETAREVSPVSGERKVEQKDMCKACSTQDTKFPCLNKDKSCSMEVSKTVSASKTRANSGKQDSPKRNNSIDKGAKQSTIKPNEGNVTLASARKSGRSREKDLKMKPLEQRRVSGNTLTKRTSNSKAWKTAQELGHLDADHVILRRMTNPQRILVGQMCASLKTKKINNQGLINESVPLAALITPALSRDTIKVLTRGTVYANTNSETNKQEETEDNAIVPDKLTGPLLAKIRQDVAENETKRRLKCFLNK